MSAKIAIIELTLLHRDVRTHTQHNEFMGVNCVKQTDERTPSTSDRGYYLLNY